MKIKLATDTEIVDYLDKNRWVGDYLTSRRYVRETFSILIHLGGMASWMGEQELKDQLRKEYIFK